jgi:hypothetical protein
VILQTVWLEGKRGRSISSFVSTVISYCVSGNMTGTDKSGTEIDSRLLISLCYANSAVLYLFLANCGKVRQQDRLLVDQRALFGKILTKGRNRPGESLEASVAYWRGAPIGDTLTIIIFRDKSLFRNKSTQKTFRARSRHSRPIDYDLIEIIRHDGG